MDMPNLMAAPGNEVERLPPDDRLVDIAREMQRIHNRILDQQEHIIQALGATCVFRLTIPATESDRKGWFTK